MSTVKRAVIIKLSSIGDVVHALPVSAALHTAFPHVRWSWLVEPDAAPVVQRNPVLDSVVVIPSVWRKRVWSSQALSVLRQLWRERFDLAVDLQGLDRSAVLAWLSSRQHRVGYYRKGRLGPRINNIVPRHPSSIHAVDQYLDVAQQLGASRATPAFPLALRAEDIAGAKQLLRGHGLDLDRAYITIHPAHCDAVKGWPLQRYVQLIEQLQAQTRLPVVLVGGASDQHAARQLQRVGAVTSVVGQTDLLQLMAILKTSKLHLTVDTGSLHLADALGTPVLALFGATDAVRNGPYHQNTRVIARRDACTEACRQQRRALPAHLPYHCVAASAACMHAIDPQTVCRLALQTVRAST